MILRRTIITFGCLCAVLGARAREKDSVDVIRHIRESFSPVTRFAEAVYANPAARPWARSGSLTTLGLTADYAQQSEAVVMQQGQGHRYAGFDADSYLHVGEQHTLWGGAGYRFGRIMNVQWNETSDFGLLYPYVMADSVGGNLSGERYTFAGGYARRSGRLSWGLYADFRAQMEVRRTDPRPRNVVSDLNLAAGMTYALGPRYRLGVGAYGRIYKQDDDIAFYDPRGRPKVYQLTGLGMYSTRFSNGKTFIHYRGGGYGASVDFFSRDRRGLSASLAYEGFRFRRIMDDPNQLPINRLRENAWRGEIAWQGGTARSVWGVKLAGGFSRRTGTELIYGESGGASNYPKIGEAEPYRGEQASLFLSGLWGWQGGRPLALYVEPRAGFYSLRSTYADPYRLMKFTKPGGGLTLTGVQTCGKSLFQLALSADCFTVSDEQTIFTGLDTATALGTSVPEQFRRMSSGYTLYGASLQWSYRLPRKLAFYLRAQGQYGSYRNGIRSRSASLTCGIGF